MSNIKPIKVRILSDGGIFKKDQFVHVIPSAVNPVGYYEAVDVNPGYPIPPDELVLFHTNFETVLDDEPDNDAVNHPAHYTSGKIEVIDFIEDKGLNYHRGNAVKYIVRAGKKDPAKEIEDLEKAAWYIAREIERINRENVK